MYGDDEDLRAVSAARASDVLIMAVGERGYERRAHPRSRRSAGSQLDLIKAYTRRASPHLVR